MPLADRTRSFYRSQASRLRGAAQIDRDMARWSESSKRAGRAAMRMGSAHGWVRADPDLLTKAAEWIASAAPAFAEAIDKHFVPLCEHAQSQWPRDTGASADAMFMAVRATSAGQATVFFASPAAYTFFVKYAKRKKLDAFGLKVAEVMEQRIGAGETVEAAAEWVADRFRLGEDGKRRALVYYERGKAPARDPGPVYQLPSGADAKGRAAWRTQAKTPFTDAHRLMLATLEAAMQRRIR